MILTGEVRGGLAGYYPGMAEVRREQSFDEALERARRGDEAEFARLWRWIQPSLLGWLRVMTPGHEEEVAAEAWLYVVRRMGSFSGDSQSFRSWVFTTARRRGIDAARRRKRTVGLHEAGDRAPLILPDNATDSLLEAAEGRDILALIRSLPTMQAHVVGLRVLAGLSVAETAAIVGKSEGAVRVLCHRGLQALASRVNQDFLQPV